MSMIGKSGQRARKVAGLPPEKEYLPPVASEIVFEQV